MKERICIIGGGISGITTALSLQLLGYTTIIYAEQVVSEYAPEDPKFASLYPAASVIPHTVRSAKTDQIFPLSQDIFEALYQGQMPGMQKNRHYELFEEEEKEDPSYAPFLKNYERVSMETEGIPKRTKAEYIEGWAFDCLFTEWPIYISQLYDRYRESGGKIIRKKIAADEISDLSSEVIVNCSGIWSAELFEEPKPLLVSKGHLIHIKDAPFLKTSAGDIPSYNYAAGSEHYADPQGNAVDVYFYPRSNGWILGGSRMDGYVDKYGRWQGPEYTGKTMLIDGLEIPQPIFELNRDIIKQTYGLDLKNFTDMRTKIGYRFVRSEERPGLRLESSQEYGKTIIHNYGHGGAGVTLSWGCGLQVADLISDSGENLDELAVKLEKKLKKVLS